MTKTTAGWVILVAAIGSMFTLLSIDLVTLKNFNEIYTPLFIGNFLGHIGSVIAAFVGGKLIPENRNENLRTRSSDKNRTDTPASSGDK